MCCKCSVFVKVVNPIAFVRFRNFVVKISSTESTLMKLAFPQDTMCIIFTHMLWMAKSRAMPFLRQ